MKNITFILKGFFLFFLKTENMLFCHPANFRFEMLDPKMVSRLTNAELNTDSQVQISIIIN